MEMVPVIQQKIIRAILKFEPVCRDPRDVIHIIPECLKPLPIGNGCMMGAVFLFGYKYMQEIIGSAKKTAWRCYSSAHHLRDYTACDRISLSDCLRSLFNIMIVVIRIIKTLVAKKPAQVWKHMFKV